MGKFHSFISICVKACQYDKGPFINYVSIFEGGRGSQNAYGCLREGVRGIKNAYVSKFSLEHC